MSGPVDFQKLFESCPGEYIVADKQHRVIAATDAFVSGAKTSHEALAGSYLGEVFPKCALLTPACRASQCTGETQLTRADG